MTEKKLFKLRYDESWVDSEYDNLIEDNNKIYTCKEVVDLLNNLTEENKQLKQELNILQRFIGEERGLIDWEQFYKNNMVEK